MPPMGPQRGTASRRMIRILRSRGRAAARMWPRRVRGPRRRRLLSRPMRVLSPPARMQTSVVRGLGLVGCNGWIERGFKRGAWDNSFGVARLRRRDGMVKVVTGVGLEGNAKLAAG